MPDLRLFPIFSPRPARSTIVGIGLSLFVFILILFMMLLAIGEIDRIYRDTSRDLDHAIRLLLKGNPPDEELREHLEAVLASLERLIVITTQGDMRQEYLAVSEIWKKARVGGADYRLLSRDLRFALETLEARLDVNREGLSASFFALTASITVLLLAALASGISLWLQLRLSSLNAAWTQRSLKASLAAEEEVRLHIARDIHDDAAQDLAAARMLCDRAAAAPDGESAKKRAREASDVLAGAGRKLRILAMNLRPPELERSGLAAALESLCARSRDGSGREVGFTLAGPVPALSDEEAIQVYRIAQEALANAAKHAAGNRVELSIGPIDPGSGTGLSLEVSDFPAVEGSESTRSVLDDSSSSGLGNAIMRERAAIIGASLDLEARNGGFLVRLSVPRAGLGGGGR